MRGVVTYGGDNSGLEDSNSRVLLPHTWTQLSINPRFSKMQFLHMLKVVDAWTYIKSAKGLTS